ncbi:SCO4848 family membrane protein [Stackebrandtia soli]|uniref:SCO4848 family membrane protein n=1 Tax=Stackebrandtia soli TaxID=1892856 RepID=UPI0039ED3CD8
MKSTRRTAGFILLVAAFMVFEWIMLGFNLADGHPTAFYVVHGILIAVNLLIALVLGVIGVRAWRSHRSAPSDG